jgi:hypothetical protein
MHELQIERTISTWKFEQTMSRKLTDSEANWITGEMESRTERESSMLQGL